MISLPGCLVPVDPSSIEVTSCCPGGPGAGGKRNFVGKKGSRAPGGRCLSFASSAHRSFGFMRLYLFRLQAGTDSIHLYKLLSLFIKRVARRVFARLTMKMLEVVVVIE